MQPQIAPLGQKRNAANNAPVMLANGQPAYTRDRRIMQSDINMHGSYAAALAAKTAHRCKYEWTRQTREGGRIAIHRCACGEEYEKDVS